MCPIPSPARENLPHYEAHVAVLDRQGRVLAVDEAWIQFDAGNSGGFEHPGPGADYLEACDRAARRGVAFALEILDGLLQVLRGHRPAFVVEYHYDSPTERRWFQFQATLLHGRLDAVAVVHAPVTRHKLAEHSLMEQEAHLQAILRSAADGILTVDDHDRIESANPAAERLFGYDPGTLVGLHLTQLMPEANRPGHAREFDACVAGRRTLPHASPEVPGLRRDGSIVPIELTLSEVQLDGRRTFTAILRDVTDRKLAEQRLLRSERLAAIGEAMTGLIHEARNALQRGQACVEMLRLQVDDRPEALRLLGRLQQAQDDLHRLYEDVREYAQPIRLDPQDCDLRQLLAEAWQRVALKRQGRAARFRLHDQPPALCRVDPFAIRRALVNVLENALDACPDPVQIDATCTLSPDGQLELRIADNGPGLPPHVAAAAFDPFFTTKTHGIGLGLPIARRDLQAHGGDLRLDPHAPHGAAFILRLPLAPEPAP